MSVGLRRYVERNYCACGHHSSVHVALRGAAVVPVAVRCKARAASGAACECRRLTLGDPERPATLTEATAPVVGLLTRRRA